MHHSAVIRVAFAVVVSVASFATTACGSSGDKSTAGTPDGGADDAALTDGAAPDGGDAAAPPPLGAPIDAPKAQWTWVDFADSSCNEGTPTGIGVYKTDSPNLVVFLNGGGACWNYATCVTLHTAVSGPYGATQFAQQTAQIAGTVLDGARTANPFAGWNMVFVPYCTGDTHSGNHVIDYVGSDPSTKVTYHHVGRTNFESFMKRVGATFPSVTKVALTGSSAGGFGAVFNYPLFRSYFPTATSLLLDDSGPTLVGDAIAPGLRQSWFDSWGLGDFVDAHCPACRTDLSEEFPILFAAYPNDRMALLESTQDATISAFFGHNGTTFEADLRDFLKQRLDGVSNVSYFIQTGTFHTFLGSPATHTSTGVALDTWLNDFVGGASLPAHVLP